MFAFTEINIRPLLFGGGLIFFLILELIIPYRKSSVSKIKRWLNNLGLTVVNSFILNLIFSTLIHLLNHEVPFLWRFHRVHHSDLNMDVSSATRFHIGELAISAVIKISLIYFLGASPVGVLIFESTIVLCAQFHHSSLKVPVWFEK
ncbi:MAG: sterol desaturase family protein, partial [Deltaproteobacteria bacterium]|nr:sterol desaturase family protein [Deltaproteobacteria bacterium]